MRPRNTRRPAAALALAVLAAFPLRLAAQLEAPPRPQGEIGFSLGAVFSFSAAESLHRQSWTAAPLAGMTAENTLAAAPAASLFLGGSYTRFFGRGIGIQAGFGYAKNGVSASASFKAGGTATAFSRHLTASDDAGEITSVPLYAGLALRWAGSRSTLVFTAGPALYLHSILVETEAGILAALSGGGAGTGAFRAPVSVPDQTWIAAGLQAGLSADLPINAATALFFELRYFYSPAKSFAWTWESGTLHGLDDSSLAVSWDAAAAAAAGAATRPLEVDPSIFQFSAGLRFRLR
ncbi:MAG: hypothetical protein PHI34_12925 [Acidobacteriota bacterium]|nr:hypothetical protein [Acidobacteriota bacterium]